MSTGKQINDVASGSTTTLPPFTTASVSYTASVPPETIEQKLEREYSERAAKLFEAQTGFLLGKVLTVIDAAIPDPKQGKAVKDLIRAQFHAQLQHVYSVCTDTRLISGPDGEIEV